MLTQVWGFFVFSFNTISCGLGITGLSQNIFSLVHIVWENCSSFFGALDAIHNFQA